MLRHSPAPTLLPRFALAALVLSFSAAVCAEKADKDKPMNVEADALRYEDTQQTSVFTGNVVLTKGTILMRGTKMDVRQDPQGNQFGLLLGTPEKPGFFRQKREGLDEWIEGEGERIEYDSKAQTVLFTGRAVLRRYRGTQLNDVIEGSRIHYNSQTEVFSVKGGESNRTAANPKGRVKAMLTPVPDKPVVTPAPDPTALRPSNELTEPTQ